MPCVSWETQHQTIPSTKPLGIPRLIAVKGDHACKPKAFAEWFLKSYMPIEAEGTHTTTVEQWIAIGLLAAGEKATGLCRNIPLCFHGAVLWRTCHHGHKSIAPEVLSWARVRMDPSKGIGNNKKRYIPIMWCNHNSTSSKSQTYSWSNSNWVWG